MAEQGLASALRTLDSLKDIMSHGDGVTEKDFGAGLYWPGASGISGIIPGKQLSPDLPSPRLPLLQS